MPMEARLRNLTYSAPIYLQMSLMNGDLESMALLARTLVLSGFGMTICGGSQPASQGEHLIAHYIEMMADPDLPASFHGEQIAVTTLTMARLQERFLAGPAPVVRAPRVEAADFEARYGPVTGRSCWQEFDKKRLDATSAEALNRRLAEAWPQIAEEIAAIITPADTLEAAMTGIAAPTRPEDLGLPADFYRDAVEHAREIRDRFTFLDLAADSGVFEAGSAP